MSELLNLSVGDRLVGDSFGRHGTYVVERLTPTMAVCEGGARFNLSTGYMVGERYQGGWGGTHVHKFGEQDAINERISVAAERLRRLTVTAKNLEQVETLFAALTA